MDSKATLKHTSKSIVAQAASQYREEETLLLHEGFYPTYQKCSRSPQLPNSQAVDQYG
jgi:hypothetical protein